MSKIINNTNIITFLMFSDKTNETYDVEYTEYASSGSDEDFDYNLKVCIPDKGIVYEVDYDAAGHCFIKNDMPDEVRDEVLFFVSYTKG